MKKFSITDLISRDGMPKVQKGGLCLRNEGLSSLEGLELIDGIENIKVLIIADTQLKELTSGVFKKFVNLKQLYLNNNQIDTLHADTFQGLESLTKLSLAGNNFTELPFDIF